MTGRMTSREAPAQALEELPAWLKEAMGNPPPVSDPEELLRAERHGRMAVASPIRDRLPQFLATARMTELDRRIASLPMRDVARSWAPRTGGNVVLLGETGQGKSTAAALIFRRILRDGWRDGGTAWSLAQGMRWFRAEQLERAMKSHPLGKGECPEYLAAVGASLLVLDEIGWERDPKGIASILAARYDSPHLTVVTSGQTLKQLSETYGDAVVRRMLTHGRRKPVIVEAFPTRDAETQARRDLRPRPPSDQEELARRMGERL